MAAPVALAVTFAKGLNKLFTFRQQQRDVKEEEELKATEVFKLMDKLIKLGNKAQPPSDLNSLTVRQRMTRWEESLNGMTEEFITLVFEKNKEEVKKEFLKNKKSDEQLKSFQTRFESCERSYEEIRSAIDTEDEKRRQAMSEKEKLLELAEREKALNEQKHAMELALSEEKNAMELAYLREKFKLNMAALDRIREQQKKSDQTQQNVLPKPEEPNPVSQLSDDFSSKAKIKPDVKAVERCVGLTASGEQCKRRPQEGRSFCHQHPNENGVVKGYENVK